MKWLSWVWLCFLILCSKTDTIISRLDCLIPREKKTRESERERLEKEALPSKIILQAVLKLPV